MKTILNCALLAVCVLGCRSSVLGPGRAARVEGAGAENTAAMNAIKGLAGSWTGTFHENNDGPTSSIFVVTSSGSAVREIMGAGTQYEMTNMYHLDGNRVLATHYCGAGNQPRMTATTASPHKIVFELESITNYTSDEHGFMGRLELEIVDKDHYIQRWTQYKDGKAEGNATFDMRRAK